MAGRPRTMAKRVMQLLDRYYALQEDFEKLMPAQYREPTEDHLGRSWQIAIQAICGISDYLEDLAFHLQFKADEAEKRAKASDVVNGRCFDVEEPDHRDGDPEAEEMPEANDVVPVSATTPVGTRERAPVGKASSRFNSTDEVG